MMKRHLPILFLLLCAAASAAVKPIDSQKIVLKPGWNLVALERPVVEADMAKFLALKPMTLDAANKCYVQCTDGADVRIGTGYWIFSRTAQTVELVRDHDKTSWETAALSQGWNFIGMADNSTWMNQATDIWQWLDGKFRKIGKEKLSGGKAYFVR